ncbi:MAG: response regulator transcription factor [Acidobacteriota bacterium]
MPRHDLLIIDDDASLNRLLTEYLAGFGHQLRSATTAAQGLGELRRQLPDLLILDIMLPDQDGLSLCRSIRGEHDMPIIMLTARGDVADRIVGLELGADDYLAKPFEPRELVARISSVLRRAREHRQQREHRHREVLRSGELRVEPALRQATLAGRALELTSTELDLLVVFLESRGRVLSRDTLLSKLHGDAADVYDRSIDMLISRLRQKLGDDSRAPRFIKTVWRTGYQFVGAGVGEA